MSEFFRALEQASKDRQQEIAARRRTEGAPVSPPPAVAAVEVTIESKASGGARPEAGSPVASLTVDAPEGMADHLVSLLSPNSFAAEQYGTLRHLVEQMRAQSGVAVVAVSSPSIADGKTTTTINLAGTLAQSRSARVLLIDMDLRRSAVLGQLGIRALGRKGVVDAIVAGASLEEVVFELPTFNLSVIPAGERQAAPYDLLKSPRLHELLAEARRRYDYIVIDTPPVIGVPDCRVISSCVDGFLMVVSAHKTQTKMLSEALGILDAAKILGLIYNRDDQPIARTVYQAYGLSETEPETAGWTRAVRRVRDGARRRVASRVAGE